MQHPIVQWKHILVGILASGLFLAPVSPAAAVNTACVPGLNQAAFFYDIDYEGACVVRSVGSYASADAIGLPNDSISSVRVGPDVRLTLYEHNDFSGRSEQFFANDSDLRDNGIGNDTVSSAKIDDGSGSSPSGAGGPVLPPCTPTDDQAVFFTGNFFTGQCAVLNIGNYASAGAVGLPNDSISSIKVGRNIQAVLYQDENYRGKSGWYSGDVFSLSGSYIGERAASSVRVQPRQTSSPAPGPVQTPVYSPPANDRFANAQILSGTSGSVFGNNIFATSEAGEQNPFATAGNHSVWYRWQAPKSGMVSWNTAGSDFNAQITVFTGTDIAALTFVSGNGAVNEAPMSSVSFRATAGTLYSISVNGFGTSVGHLALRWNTAPAPQAVSSPADHPVAPVPVKKAKKYRSPWSSTN